MCGILGAVVQSLTAAQESRFDSALHALRHRGPDDFGVESLSVAGSGVMLGHVRLSIIDLTLAGHQPLHSRDGRYIIVFNGEIYNYRELRQELKILGHTFYTESDTEVLLVAWIAWGPVCLSRLVGMFAFAVLDRQAATLTCARDAFGIKPFFYSQDHDSFLFASEPPALLKLRNGKARLNWQRAYDYLAHGDYDSVSETFFDGIVNLPAGHFVNVDVVTGKVKSVERWWVPRIGEQLGLGFEDAVQQVRSNFLESVRLHLRSDVPLGVALSGGVDSSAVVCAVRHIAPDLPIHTFSYIAAGCDVSEEHWVDLANQHVGAISHKVFVTPSELARDLDDMIQMQGEPFGSTSIYAQYRVYRLAKESGITVTLDGQGADEMLAGYSGYPGQRLRSLIETGHWQQAVRFLHSWSQWPGRSMAQGLTLLLAEMTDGALYQALRRLSGRHAIPAWVRSDVLERGGVQLRHPRQRPELDVRGRRVMAELSHSLARRGLVSLLRHGDRNSMRFSIESRVPFLTVAQAEFLLSMPEHYLIAKNGETKSVFRAAMRGIVPDAILDRKDKIGFQTPEELWLTSMAGTIRQWLSMDIDLPFLDQEAVVREFDQVVSGRKKFSWQVWRWINFIRWHQHFLN